MPTGMLIELHHGKCDLLVAVLVMPTGMLIELHHGKCDLLVAVLVMPTACSSSYITVSTRT